VADRSTAFVARVEAAAKSADEARSMKGARVD